MRRIIHNLRQKPEHVRQMVSFVTSLGITAVIVGFWIFGLVTHGPSGSLATQEDSAAVASIQPSPLSVLKEQMASVSGALDSDLNSGTDNSATPTVTETENSSSSSSESFETVVDSNGDEHVDY